MAGGHARPEQQLVAQRLPLGEEERGEHQHEQGVGRISTAGWATAGSQERQDGPGGLTSTGVGVSPVAFFRPDASLTRRPAARRVVQDITDVNQIHLPSQALVGGVDVDHPPVPAEPRVQIDPEFSLETGDVLGRRSQLGERDEQLCRPVIEEEILVAGDHVRVGDDPIAAGPGEVARGRSCARFPSGSLIGSICRRQPC